MNTLIKTSYLNEFFKSFFVFYFRFLHTWVFLYLLVSRHFHNLIFCSWSKDIRENFSGTQMLLINHTMQIWWVVIPDQMFVYRVDTLPNYLLTQKKAFSHERWIQRHCGRQLVEYCTGSYFPVTPVDHLVR